MQRNNFLLLSSPLTTAIGTYRGGIRLRCPPHDINIGQVLRETEDKLDVIGCLGRRDYCPIERVCMLRGVLHDAFQAFLAVLDGYTLADLIKPQRALSSLLLLDRHARVAHNGQSSRNRSTACTSEIDFSPTLLALADEVIELGLHQMLHLLTAGCGIKRR